METISFEQLNEACVKECVVHNRIYTVSQDDRQVVLLSRRNYEELTSELQLLRILLKKENKQTSETDPILQLFQTMRTELGRIQMPD
ncbi:MAG: hypothetical protein HUJ58_01540 [Erysipelotrichaceae bacterium]|nr:hypothetical protein [Erysipelotrichaceae bacterium]